MQLRLISAADVVCPVAKIALERRRLQTSDYLFPIERILSRMRDLIEATIVRDWDRQVDVVVICSEERTFAAFPTRARATIFIDVGFIELVVDFVGATYGMGDFINILQDDLPILVPPYAGLTWDEQDIYVAQFFPQAQDPYKIDMDPRQDSPREGEALGQGLERMQADNPSLSDRHENQESDYIEVTGSQLFRDMACKMVEGLRLSSSSRKLFESVILWGLGDGQGIHRPGAALFNAAALRRFRRMPDSLAAADALQELTLDCVSMIGLHEVAHALYDRDACADWRNSDEFAAVLTIIRLFDDETEFGRTVASLWGEFVDPDYAVLANRAIDEAFYDVRALAIMINGARGSFEHDIPSFFEMRLRVMSDGIMVKILREYLLISFRDPHGMNRAGELAYVETVLRVMLLFGYLQAIIPSFTGGRPTHFLFSVKQDLLERAQRFYYFFRADILNGLPQVRSEKGQDFADTNLDVWSAFITDVINAAPEAQRVS